MKTIYYITKNEEKIKSANAFLKEFGIDVSQGAIETPEIQSSHAKDVAMYSAEYGSKTLGKPVIKMDVEFCIESLNNFPGPFIKYLNKCVSPEKVLLMMQGEVNRKAYFNDVVCFFDSSKNISKVFEFRTEGVIGEKVLGEEGWGIDKIFIPEGYKKTLAEMSEVERLEVWKNNLWEELANFIKKI